MANGPDNQNPNEGNPAGGGSPDNPDVAPKPIEKLSIEKLRPSCPETAQYPLG